MFTVVGKLNRLKVVLRTLNKEGSNDVEQRAVEPMEKFLKYQKKIQHVLYIDIFKEEIHLARHYEQMQKAKYQHLQ